MRVEGSFAFAFNKKWVIQGIEGDEEFRIALERNLMQAKIGLPGPYYILDNMEVVGEGGNLLGKIRIRFMWNMFMFDEAKPWEFWDESSERIFVPDLGEYVT